MSTRPRRGPRATDLSCARAHWLTRALLALPVDALPPRLRADDLRWELVHARDGGIERLVDDDPFTDVVPQDASLDIFVLELDGAGLPEDRRRRVPHLSATLALRLPQEAQDRAADLLEGQVALLARGPGGADQAPVLATSLQIPHVLDDLYGSAATRVDHGPTWRGEVGRSDRRPTLRVWAPTARTVSLLLWDDLAPPEGDLAWSPPGEPTAYPMEREPDGTWVVTGEPSWADRCYQFEVTTYRPELRAVQAVRSTDPWSVGLAIGSTHSVLVDLQDPRWTPEGWAGSTGPALAHPVDQTVYELHVRDFSRDDPSVEAGERGSFLGFRRGLDSHGLRHLRTLAQAGLNTVHLLPVFDLTSVEEDRALQASPDPRVLAELSEHEPAGTEQQRLVRETAVRDAFNWGYDPWHFMTPEGSYAAPSGAAHGGRRVAQCREMVAGLHELGLRVVLDQVYNHTTDSGLARASVLDRIVPGYYHRLDGAGRVETSTCCQNLATEHAMAMRLMVDACVLWVRHYRVDGYRFDLMGHHGRAELEAVRAALDELTVDEHGIDGRAVTLYGEGWNFGEVAGNARFHQAIQGQLAGTGIGTFNDRIRDAVRGGSVHDVDPRTRRGFATGGTDPRHTDLLQVGLAGGLADLVLRSQETGRETTGSGIPYGGAPGGYARDPEEVVNYVDAHDNETLWDTLVLKLPRSTPMAERIRRNTLALATVTLSQGISFWHAGAEILRSKCLDRNSYESGDWFNLFDVTLQDNGFGRGLPPAPDNGRRWRRMGPLLRDPRLRPTPQDIAHARDCALDLLRVRRDLPLLRLADREAILGRVSFPVSGTDHGRPDVVVMLVDDPAPSLPRAAAEHSGAMVVLNGSTEPVTQVVPVCQDQEWQLHPVLREGADPVVRETRWDAAGGAVVIPALTAAVLVRPR